MKMMKNNTILKLINNSLIDLPTPSNISMWWNFGSMLGLCLLLRIITGMFLSMHFCPNTTMAFESISHIYRDVNYGWLIRIIHPNGASMFFICLYLHIGRGLYYGSYLLKQMWTVGVMIILITMGTAFLGYVLPWSQMSFWGSTVITNLISTIPYLGTFVVQWLWGGFLVENPTLNRFFSLHFMLPFVIIAMVMIHLMFLYQTGSNNPLGINSNMDKIPFHPYYTVKNMMWIMMMFLLITLSSLIKPFLLSDPDNFVQANPMMTPSHIKPEWYFLFAYAILRFIPNKLGGVVALIMSISIMFIMPMMNKSMQSNKFYPPNKLLFWMFISTSIMLTWIGAQEVEIPFITMSQILAILYFSFLPLNFILYKFWDKMLKM